MQDPKKNAAQVNAYSRARLDKITPEESSKKDRPICAATMPVEPFDYPPPYRGQVLRKG